MPNAPPPGWNPDEKSGMGQPAPPPYQDQPQYPNTGYTVPAGYPPNPQGYAPPPQYGGAPGAPYGQPYPQGQYPQSTVTIQPTVFVTHGALPYPLPDYLGYSIFTMLCCCLPLGIAALIYSISVTNLAVVISHWYFTDCTMRVMVETSGSKPGKERKEIEVEDVIMGIFISQ